MKNKNKLVPLVFFIFGLIIILTVALLSVKKYISQNENNFKNNISKETTQKSDQEKVFFNEPKKFPSTTSVVIYKGKRIVELYGDNKLIGRFKMTLGRVPKGKKQEEGDDKTPEGNYYICYINPNSKYDCFLGISYPNIEDAKEALNNDIINDNTFQKIKKAIENKKQPPWDTPLGGSIGIHGGGTQYNWTQYNWTHGCIAVSDEDIDTLKRYIFMKTSVKIYK